MSSIVIDTAAGVPRSGVIPWSLTETEKLTTVGSINLKRTLISPVLELMLN